MKLDIECFCYIMKIYNYNNLKKIKMLLFVLIITQFFNCVSSLPFSFISKIQFNDHINLKCNFNKNDTFNSYVNFSIKNNNFFAILNIINKTTYSFQKENNELFIINDKLIFKTNNSKKFNFKCLLSNLTLFIHSVSLNNSNIEYIIFNYIELIKINIIFKKIFSLLKCFIQIKNESFISESEKIHFLYSSVNLTLKMDHTYNLRNIEFICTLFENDDNIDLKNKIIIIFAILFLILNIILIKIFYFKKKSKLE